MAIISVPKGVNVTDTVTCAICEQEVILADATVGPLDMQNQQAFACNIHFTSSGQYILGWTEFARIQKQGLAAVPLKKAHYYARVIH